MPTPDAPRQLAFVLASCSLFLLFARPPAAFAQLPPSRGMEAQMGALLMEKALRSPDERKIDSNLLRSARSHRRLPALPGLPPLRDEIEVARDGSVEVDVRATAVEGIVDRMRRQMGRDRMDVVSEHRHGEVTWLRLRVPIVRIWDLAALPEVESIAPASRPFTRALNVSQGDVAHRVDRLRASFPGAGAGIAVGVISDGVDALPSLQATGDLPPDVVVLPGRAGSGTEGAAMLEIVRDLAPASDLLFATALGGKAAFADAIRALRNAGADVIVDDIAYFDEAVYQDDVVAAAVDEVAATGVLYFSAAGNEGNRNDGTAGAWEGSFRPSPTRVNGLVSHDFGGGVFANEITQDSPLVFTLQWGEPQGGATTDYDLLLVDPAVTTIIAASTNFQDGDDDPFEIISSQLRSDTGNRLIVLRWSGGERLLKLNAFRGRLARATEGQISGHAAARGALAVAATDVRQARGAGGVFDGRERVESFSSDGPRRVLFEADGSPITPGNLTNTGGELRAKPELTAADCVRTAAPGFATFCGTSAAAPHAAAIAAVLRGLPGRPGSPAEVRDALLSTALDIEAPGVDRDAGAGIVQALAAATGLSNGECSNGVDDDGDGFRDHPADPGCESASDPSERSSVLPCDDGVDNDGDGRADFPADLGCGAPIAIENPPCQDGIDNDGAPGTDFDGGLTARRPGGADPAGPDPQCTAPSLGSESGVMACGLGMELLLVAPLLLALRHRTHRHG